MEHIVYKHIAEMLTEQKDTTYEEYENSVAQGEIDNWENREQYGIEW